MTAALALLVTACGAGRPAAASGSAPSSPAARESTVAPGQPTVAPAPNPPPSPNSPNPSSGFAAPSSGTAADQPPPETSAPPSSRPTATAPAPAGFAGSVAAIDPAIAARMGSSWRPDCPVPLDELRYLSLTYRGFDGADHQGELVVAARVADDVVAIFRRLYEIGYPIASMRLVDDFAGDDERSMSANNTSAFNCRPVTGGGEFSEHSYGTAIDVNPVQNPYLSGSTVLPPEGAPYVSRPNSPGVIQAGDDVVRAFADHGFSWGGAWRGPVDYQHFSTSGR